MAEKIGYKRCSGLIRSLNYFEVGEGDEIVR